ncbi:hypothetical protein Q1695_002198 [Nippostrongylus brasiliensis]|nr:hypothetical protein Q1695_002198 [Nippostrongylus brasiliensis]
MTNYVQWAILSNLLPFHGIPYTAVNTPEPAISVSVPTKRTRLASLMKKLSSELKTVLDDYVNTGEVEAIFYSKGVDVTQASAIMDCIIRSRYHSSYVIMSDLDERIVAGNTNESLVSLVLSTMERHKNVGSITFQSRFIFRTAELPSTYKGEKTLREHLPTLVFDNITLRVAYIRRKCIINPFRVLEMGVHAVHSFLGDYINLELPLSAGYVSATVNDNSRCNNNNSTDNNNDTDSSINHYSYPNYNYHYSYNYYRRYNNNSTCGNNYTTWDNNNTRDNNCSTHNYHCWYNYYNSTSGNNYTTWNNNNNNNNNTRDNNNCSTHNYHCWYNYYNSTSGNNYTTWDNNNNTRDNNNCSTHNYHCWYNYHNSTSGNNYTTWNNNNNTRDNNNCSTHNYHCWYNYCTCTYDNNH